MKRGEWLSMFLIAVGVAVCAYAVSMVISSRLGDELCVVSSDRPIYPVNGTIELSASPLREGTGVEVVERLGDWVTVAFDDRQGRVHDPNEDLCAEGE